MANKNYFQTAYVYKPSIPTSMCGAGTFGFVAASCVPCTGGTYSVGKQTFVRLALLATFLMVEHHFVFHAALVHILIMLDKHHAIVVQLEHTLKLQQVIQVLIVCLVTLVSTPLEVLQQESLLATCVHQERILLFLEASLVPVVNQVPMLKNTVLQTLLMYQLSNWNLFIYYWCCK